jgi:hypothetical protein
MQNVMSRVASFADIDTRRALGVYGRLPRSDFVPRPIEPTTFRYFPALKKLLYVNFDESYDVFTWELFEEIEPDGDAWIQARNGRHRGVWHGLDDFVYFDTRPPFCPIHFAGTPEFKDSTSLIV